MQNRKTGKRKISREGTPWTQVSPKSVSIPRTGWWNDVFLPSLSSKRMWSSSNYLLQIESWTFSVICFNIINNHVLWGCSRPSSLHVAKHTHTQHWPTFFEASGCTFWLPLINILISSYQIIMGTPSLEQIQAHARTHRRPDRQTHIRLKGERALWSSVTSISYLVPCKQNPVGCLRDTLHNQCQSKGEGQHGPPRSRPSVPVFLPVLLFWVHG